MKLADLTPEQRAAYERLMEADRALFADVRETLGTFPRGLFKPQAPEPIDLEEGSRDMEMEGTIISADAARDKAIQWQTWASEQSLSMSELAREFTIRASEEGIRQ
jgi:hypothetical protein